MIWQGLKRIHLHLDGLAFSATLWIPKNQSSLKVNWCFEGWPFSALQTRRSLRKLKKKFEPFRFGLFIWIKKISLKGVWSTRRAHSCLTNFYATGYHHLGAGSNDTSAREFSQAHPADLLNIPKLTYIFRNNHRIKILKTPFESL